MFKEWEHLALGGQALFNAVALAAIRNVRNGGDMVDGMIGAINLGTLEDGLSEYYSLMIVSGYLCRRREWV